MNIKGINSIVKSAVLVTVSFSSYGELIDRGGGLIYDTVLNVTWLGNANYAAAILNDVRVDELISLVGSVDGHVLSNSDFLKNSNTGEYSGQMSWWGAKSFVQELVYEHPTLKVLYNDWRLPIANAIDGSCTNLNGDSRGDALGFNCVGGEFGNLFYSTFMGSASLSAASLNGSMNPELLKFSNVKWHYYHSETSIDNCPNLPSLDCNVYFSMYSGFQWGAPKSNLNYVWILRDGDVAFHDYDNDTIVDFNDNCPLTSNADQFNNDADNQGDVCDDDDDNDGLTDIYEISINTDPFLIDTDGDTVSDYNEVNSGMNPLSQNTDNDAYLDDVDPLPVSFNYEDGDVAPYGFPNTIINIGDLLIGMQLVLGVKQTTDLEKAHMDLYPPGAPDGEITLSDYILLQKLIME